MVQSLVVYNLENKLVVWYTSPKLKFFKLDGEIKLDINGQTILTLAESPDTVIDITDNIECNWRLKQVSKTKYEITDLESSLIKFGDFNEYEL